MNLEAERTRGRLEAQVREAAASNSAWRGRPNAGARTRSGALASERDALAGAAVGELEREMQQVRTGLLEKNQARDAIQAASREPEQTIEASASVILRLLGEASTIRNQIAQADTYLAGIERERARVRKEEEVAAAEIERLARREGALRIHRRRQLELEASPSTAATPRKAWAREKPQPADFVSRSTSCAPSVPPARQESLENILSHHTYTTESTKKLLAALENGAPAVPSRRRAGRFHRSRPGLGARRGRVSPRRTRIRGREGLGRRPSRA